MKHYAERDIEALDNEGSYYINHVMAMTSESLDSKSKIAAELGYRDMVIDSLIEELKGIMSVYDFQRSVPDEYFTDAKAAIAKADLIRSE
ncbi:hypothetical protein [Enterobacter hormaechei]